MSASDGSGRVIVHTEPLGGSPLARALQEGRAPSSWTVAMPGGADAWAQRVADVRHRFREVDWLAPLRPALRGSDAARARLERVMAAGGIVITTGQQPGLFGGPVYTWSKAVTALALADAMERRLGVPAAPLFWAATDDADLLEAQTVWVAAPEGAVELRGQVGAPAGTPAARAPLGVLDAELEALRSAAGSAAGAEVLAAVQHAYGDPGRTVGDAYLLTLEVTLGTLDIPILDAAHPAVARAGDALLRRALTDHARVDDALAARVAEIRAAGYEPQVDRVPGLTMVFAYETDGTKHRVPADGAAAVAASHGSLGPNVLLRPVLEAAILPTVTYVAGPAELAYFVQVTAVAEALAARVPLAVPRWSCTLEEPRMRRLLERLELTRDALRDVDAAANVLARRATPDPVHDALTRLQPAFDVELARLQAADTTGLIPPAVLAGVRARIAHQLARLERRMLAAVKRREVATLRDLARARGFFYPAGKRQERMLSIVPTLARYGIGTLHAMRHEADAHADVLLHGGRGLEPGPVR